MTSKYVTFLSNLIKINNQDPLCLLYIAVHCGEDSSPFYARCMHSSTSPWESFLQRTPQTPGKTNTINPYRFERVPQTLSCTQRLW